MFTPRFPKPRLSALIEPAGQSSEPTPATPSPETQTLKEIASAVTEKLGLHVMRNATIGSRRHDLIVTPTTDDMRVVATVDLSSKSERGISIDVRGQVVRITTPNTDAGFAIASITNFAQNRGETDLLRLAYATLEGKKDGIVGPSR